MITSTQIKALGKALKNGGFESTEDGKAEGRDFITFLLGREYDNIAQLTTIEAEGILAQVEPVKTLEKSIERWYHSRAEKVRASN